ncbi:MAG: LysR family transcriptional regulator [Solirubrobacterales bacterium]|jgi:DNA-binding transcriptional LysR family regulator|nr:LysR family transcriptional regulator [Solirubrobacterales bacterium]
MLDVRRMRVLREVARRGSFSAAAEALAYTQSAVSQQIAALEREAGTKLVERNARGVRLTDAGHVVVRHADAILARLADAESELEAIAGLRGGRLRLASFPSAGASVMPKAIAAFRERHPAVELSLQLSEPDDAVALIRAGEVDIALTISTAFENACAYGAGIEELHLMDDPMYVILPASHPLAHRRTLRLDDLAEEQWTLGATGTCPDTSIFLRTCQAAGFEPRISFESNDYLAIQGFVAAEMGVSFIPDLALVTVRDDIVVRSLGARPPVRRIMAATLTDSYRSPAKEAMLGVLAEVSQDFGCARRELALAS